MNALTILLAVVAGAAVSGAVFYLVFFSSRKNDEASRLQAREDFRALLELAEQKFETERVKQKSELDEKKVAVENAVDKLSERLKNYEELVRKFEADRATKYGSLEKGLRDATEQTAKLATSTEGLRALMDNSARAASGASGWPTTSCARPAWPRAFNTARTARSTPPPRAPTSPSCFPRARS
ncbi:MAG: hypothetical protein M0D55_18065 [Elusimicrobiota bacterium]|nr:MAG: hypothetical protein M0D55_18065 [Elusimicrobiota bacterium]